MASNANELRVEEGAEIANWRYETLLRAGYAEQEAVVLATRDDIDLHRACELVARGCPSGTALRILA